MEAQVEQVEFHQVVAEQVALPVAATRLAQVEQEPEGRCVYGPGDSKYSRVIWPGCAEA